MIGSCDWIKIESCSKHDYIMIGSRLAHDWITIGSCLDHNWIMIRIMLGSRLNQALNIISFMKMLIHLLDHNVEFCLDSVT